MKVAVSIPDPVFAKAEALAKRLKLSRSKVYARAIDEFVLNHSPDEITAAINAAIDEFGDMSDPVVLAAGARTAARHTDW